MQGLTANYDKDKNIVMFLDASGKVALVYMLPKLKHAKKSLHPPAEWENHELIITLPDVTYPLSLVFDIGVRIPDTPGKLGFGFGLRSQKGTTEDPSDRETKKSFKVRTHATT